MTRARGSGGGVGKRVGHASALQTFIGMLTARRVPDGHGKLVSFLGFACIASKD
jgi:hypothetical protein